MILRTKLLRLRSDCLEEVEQARDLMSNNDRQLKMFDLLADEMLNFSKLSNTKRTNSHFYFLDGGAGTGKSFILETLHFFAAAHGFQIMNTAFTNLAAHNLPNGLTLHAAFRLPLNLIEGAQCSVEKSTTHAFRIEVADTLIIDEATQVQIG